jgi:hypothetical protein
MKPKLKITLLLLLFTNLTLAQSSGQTTYQFLELTASPAMNAMGGKNISNPNYITFVAFNPALLDSNKQKTLTVNYLNYLSTINLGQIFYTLPPKKFGYFAIGVHYINYGKFECYDQNGNFTGYFRASENAFILSYAIKLDSHITIGLNVKPIYSKLENYTSLGIATDLGMLITINQYNHIALVLRNKGKQFSNYTSTNEQLPVNFMAGFTSKLKYSPLRFNITFEHLENWHLRFTSPLNQLYAVTFADTTSFFAKVRQISDEIMRHSLLATEIMLHPNLNLIIGYNYRRGQELSLPTRRTLSVSPLALN